MDNLESRINAWTSLPNLYQKQYISQFTKLAELCRNDISKKAKLWEGTVKEVQEQYQEFFISLLKDITYLHIEDIGPFALALEYPDLNLGDFFKHTSINVLKNNLDSTIDMFSRLCKHNFSDAIALAERLQRNGCSQSEKYVEEFGNLIKQHISDDERAENSVTPEEMTLFYCEANGLITDLIKKFGNSIPVQTQTDFIELHQRLTNQVLKHPDILTQAIEENQFLNQIQLDIPVLISLIKYNLHQPEKLSTLLSKVNLDTLGIEGLVELNNNGIDISQFIASPINIPLNEYKTRGNDPNIPSKLKVCLICENASELSIEDLQKLPQSSRCTNIAFRAENLGPVQEAPYSIKEYVMYRKTIDKILQNIVIPALDIPNREKKIFGQVMPIIASQIEYQEGQNRFQHGKGNCQVFSEMVRNVFSCLGIDVKKIGGSFRNGSPTGHSWNQIKLDGKWYNSDLTFSRDAIIDYKRTGKISPDIFQVLANDVQFDSGIHDEVYQSGAGHNMFYIHDDISYETCNDTVNTLDLISYLRDNYIDNVDCGTWLRNASIPLRTTLIKSIGTMLSKVKARTDTIIPKTKKKDEYDK